MRGEVKSRIERLAKAAERRRTFLALRKSTIRKTNFLQRKPVIDPHDVYHLVKEFFMLFLEQDREFTINELRKELKNVYVSNHTRRLVDKLFSELHEIEYHEITATHDEMVELLATFTSVVKQLIRSRTRKKGMIARLKLFLFKEEDDPEVIISELPVVEENDEENIRMHTLVEQCYIALDKHQLRRAKAAYAALLAEYGKLPENDRQQFYPLLHQTYLDMRNRSQDQKSSSGLEE